MIRGYLETAEVAKLLGITTEATLKLAHRGTLRSNFLAGRRLFDPKDVDALIADPLYAKRTRRGTQPVKDVETPSLFAKTSHEPDSAGSRQTEVREAESELEAKR